MMRGAGRRVASDDSFREKVPVAFFCSLLPISQYFSLVSSSHLVYFCSFRQDFPTMAGGWTVLFLVRFFLFSLETWMSCHFDAFLQHFAASHGWMSSPLLSW